MYFSRLFTRCAALVGILLLLSSYSEAYSQHLIPEKAIELRQNLVDKDTTEVCRLIGSQLDGQKLYLIEYERAIAESIVIVIDRVTANERTYIITQGESSYSSPLPCILALPVGQAKITRIKLFLVGQPSPYEYRFLDAREKAGFWHVIIPPPPPVGPPRALGLNDIRFIKCARPSIGGLDAPRIQIPLTNRKISYLTTSFGALTAGTFVWYLAERNNADDEFAKYRAATRIEDVVTLRIRTESARSRRNIAGYVSIGSGAVFAVLLVRDLMRSKPPESDSQEQTPSPEAVTKKLGFKLNSNPQTYALAIGVQVNF